MSPHDNEFNSWRWLLVSTATIENALTNMILSLRTVNSKKTENPGHRLGALQLCGPRL